MANFFDQFDPPTPSVRAGTPAQGANFFDQFDESAPTPQPTPTAPSGIWNNATAGLNEAINTVAGAPVDLATWILNQAGKQARVISGAPVQEIQPGIGGSQSIASGLEKLGVNDPSKVQAVTPGEQVARAAGAGAGYILAPEAALGGLTKAGVIGERIFGSLAPIFGRSSSAADVAGNAVVGAAGGAGGELVADELPEKYRPLGEFAGNVLGGGLAAGAMAVPAATRGAVRTVGEYVAPMTQAGQQRAAGAVLRDAASDPNAVRAALDAPPPPLVAGSQPTTFQMTGDMGLGGLERAVAAKNPEAFQQRAADQNAARVSTLEAVQPKGHPEAIIGSLRDNLAALDQSTFEAVDAARKAAQQATGKLGGTGTPEGYGFALRQSLDAAQTAAKAQEGKLWQAVDPTGTLNLHAADAKKMAQEILKALPKMAKPMSGEEMGIFMTAASAKPVVKFSEMTALRSRVSDAMSEELSRNGSTRVYARLSQLRGAIEADIEGAVARKAAQEADAVASGAMREEDTMIAQWARDRSEWLAERAQVARTEASSGAGAAFGSGSPPVSSASRGQGQSRRGFSDPKGDSRLSIDEPRLLPNFDDGAADRLKVASAATRQRGTTYDTGAVRDVLGRLQKEGPFHVQDSAVPFRFFHAGPTGYQDVQALRTAAAGQPGTMEKVRDYAISTLRKAAEEPDGTLNPEKVDRWRKSHADALRAFPEIDGLLKTPVHASETMIRLAEQRKADLDAFQSGSVARLLGVDDPSDVTRIVGGIFSRQDAAKQMGLLAEHVASNPAAKEGLRKAIVDFITTRFVSNTEAATSGVDLLKPDRFQTFLKQGEAALSKVFTPQEMSNFQAIAADLKQANRSISAVKLPGGSNTTQDITAISGYSTRPSILSQVLVRAGSAVAGTLTSGPIGTLAGVLGSEAVLAARNAGLNAVDDLVREAMLNPARAKALLDAAPNYPNKVSAISFVQRFNRAVAAGEGEDR